MLLPGATLLFEIIWLEPTVKAFLLDEEITIGALGLFTIAAYLAGHLIQSFGNNFRADCMELRWKAHSLDYEGAAEALNEASRIKERSE